MVQCWSSSGSRGIKVGCKVQGWSSKCSSSSEGGGNDSTMTVLHGCYQLDGPHHVRCLCLTFIQCCCNVLCYIQTCTTLSLILSKMWFIRSNVCCL